MPINNPVIIPGQPQIPGSTGFEATGIEVGVSGISSAPFGGSGVVGRSDGGKSNGFLAGTDPQFRQSAGVYGESGQQGVIGLTTVSKGTGVYGGGTTAAGGAQIGVRGETSTGVGVQGQSFGAGLAGKFIGMSRSMAT